MAIYTPGIRDRHNKVVSKGGRNVVAILSLTAMVDMFTVLVVFLLQNYKIEAIQLQKSISLPEAQAVKKLMPAHVVAVSEEEIFVDGQSVTPLQGVKEQEAWLIIPLQNALQEAIKKSKDEASSGIKSALQKTVADAQTLEDQAKAIETEAARVTVQAAKNIDFLTIKKVMHSVTESGAIEINFAVVEVGKPN